MSRPIFLSSSVVFAVCFLMVAPTMAASTGPEMGANCPVTTFYLANPDEPRFTGGVAPAGPFVAPAPIVIRGYGLAFNSTVLVLNLTLAEPPPFGSLTEHYRYWLGFEVQLPDGTSQYLDVRVAHTATYETGSLVGSNEMASGIEGNPRLALLPARWEGPTLSFDVPLHLMSDALGDKPFEIALSGAASHGPHPSVYAQSEPGWSDRVDADPRHLEFASPPPCTVAPQEVAAVIPTNPAPSAGWIVTGTILALAARAASTKSKP